MIDDETVDLYDDMLVEAEDSINYPEFLVQLKALEPREILETNAVEDVGSDIEPLLPFQFRELRFEWMNMLEMQKQNERTGNDRPNYEESVKKDGIETSYEKNEESITVDIPIVEANVNTGVLIRDLLESPSSEGEASEDFDEVELKNDDKNDVLRSRALTGFSSQVVASEQFYTEALPGTETDDQETDSETITLAELEIKPLKSVTIQDIREIGKKFLHLSVKKVEEGEVIVEFRRYGIDAPELVNVSGDTENFIEHPEQYVEITKLEEIEGEVKKVTRYYKHDDPELLKYLSRTGLTSVEQLSKLSHDTTPVTRLDKTGFLKGSLEYYMNDDENYSASVRFVDVTDLNENIIESREYEATDTEMFDLPRIRADDLDFKPFEEEFYELSFCFMLPSGKPVYFKRWAPLNEQLFQTLLQREFPKVEVFQDLGRLRVSRQINQADDILLNFLPRNLNVSTCDVVLEINPVLGVKITEHLIDDTNVVVEVDIVMAPDRGDGDDVIASQVESQNEKTSEPQNERYDPEVETEEESEFKQKDQGKDTGLGDQNKGSGIDGRDEEIAIMPRRVVRHVFYSTLPDVTILTEKRLVHKTRDDTKVIGRLFEIQKSSSDLLGRQITRKSRFVNPSEKTILTAEELQGMYHFLKIQFEEPGNSYLHTKNDEECPAIENYKVEFLPEMLPNPNERFTFEEKFKPSVGTGERTIRKYTKDKKSDCIIESRTYKSAINKVLIVPIAAEDTEPLFYEFTLIQHAENKTIRNRVWIPVGEKLPTFLTHSENLPLKASRKFHLITETTDSGESPLNMLFNSSIKVSKMQHVETSNLIDANRFDILDSHELDPKTKKTKIIVEVRPILEVYVNELWDGKTRWLLLDRQIIDYDQVYHFTSYYQVKYPTVRKVRKSKSSIKLFSSSLVGNRALISPNALRLKRSKIEDEKRKRRVASKLYFALYTGEDTTLNLATSKEFLPIENVLNAATENEKQFFNTVEIHSRVSKAPDPDNEQVEAEEFEEEELEITETTPIGISVKQIVQEEKPRVVIFEGTSYDVDGKPYMQQKTFRADDELLFKALEKDPNAMVLPYTSTMHVNDQDSSNDPGEISEPERKDENLLSAPINIDVRGNDGTHFFYQWVDGKVLSTENLNETVTSRDDDIDPSQRESIFEGETMKFQIDTDASEEAIKEPKRHHPKKITRKVLKIIDPGSKEQLSLEEAYRGQLIDGETYLNLKEKNLMKKPKVYDPVSRKPMSFVQMKDIGLELPPVMRPRQSHAAELSEESLDSDEWHVTDVMEQPASAFRTITSDQVTLAQQIQEIPKIDKKLAESAKTIKALAITLPEVVKPKAREVINEDKVMVAVDERQFKARLSKKVTVIDPLTGERVSLDEGFRRGLFDEVTYEQFKLNEFVETGIPISREEYQELIKLERPLQISYETEQLVFSQEIDEGLMELNILEDLVPEVETQKAVYVDPVVMAPDQQETMSPEKAFQKGLIDHSTYCNLIEYDTSVQLVTVQTTKTVPVRPLEMMESPVEQMDQLYNFEEVMETLEPVVEEMEDFQTTIYNPTTNDLVSPITALELGLIDKPTYTKLTIEVTSVLEEPRLLIDSENFVLKVWISDPLTGQKISPTKAFAKGLINTSILEILEHAPKEIQYLSPKSDLWKILIFECVNSSDNITQISFDDAIDMGIIDASFYIRVFENAKHKPLMSSSEIPEKIRAKFEQISRSPKSRDSGMEPEGMIVVTDPETGMNKSLDDALILGLIDEKKYEELKRRETEGIFELEVSTINGDVCVIVSQSGETFTVEEAFTRGLITLPDYEKIKKDKDNFKTTRYLSLPQSITLKDPTSKKTLTLEEAVQENLISQSAYVEIVSRANFKLESSLSFGESGISVQEPLTGDIIPLHDAVKRRLITQTQMKILQEKSKEPLGSTKGENLIFVPGLVSLYDPVSGRDIPLTDFEETQLNVARKSKSSGNLLQVRSRENQSLFKSESNLGVLEGFANIEIVFDSIDLNEIVFPSTFDFATHRFGLSQSNVSKSAHQIPGAYKIVVKETGTCLSVKDALAKKLITIEERDALITEQLGILRNYIEEVSTHVEIENIPDNESTYEENSNVPINELKMELLKFLSKVRLFGLLAQNDVIKIYNPHSDKLEVSKTLPEDILLRISVFVFVCEGEESPKTLEKFLDGKHSEAEASFEEFMSRACLNPNKAGLMLVYNEKLAEFANIEDAVKQKWVQFEKFCELRQKVLRDSIFMQNQKAGNAWTSLPECLALGMLSDTRYDKLTMTLPKTCSLKEIQIYDPLLVTQLDLVASFESGILSFEQTREVIEVCCQKSGITSKIFAVDRSNGVLLAPHLALETELISRKVFDSLFLTSTESFEKVAPPNIEILNPNTGEIFSLGEALNLGFINFETYDALCTVSNSSPMSVPRLLVLLEDSGLASPITAHFDKMIEPSVYENLKNENIQCFLPLMPTGITICSEDGYLTSLDECFIDDLVTPIDFAEILANLSECPLQTPSFLVMDSENMCLHEIKEAVLDKLITLAYLETLDPSLLTKYKYSDINCFIPRQGKKLLKDRLVSREVRLRSFIEFTLMTDEIETLVVYNTKTEKLYNQSTALEEKIITSLDLSGLNTDECEESIFYLYIESENKIISLDESYQTNLLSFQTYQDTKYAFHDRGQYLTKVLIYLEESQSVCTTYEAVLRETISGEMLLEFGNANTMFLEFVPDPKIRFFDLESNSEMTLNEAVVNGRLLPENVALLIEHLENEPEVFPRTLIIQDAVLDAVLPLEAVENEFLTRIQLEALCEVDARLKIPFKETGLFVWLSLSKIIMSLFEALHERVLPMKAFLAIVEKMKQESELVTKLLVLDETTGDIFTPLMAVDLEVMDMESFDYLLLESPHLLQPIKSTGIIVLDFDSEKMEKLENCVVNGIISLECYTETLKLFSEKGNELRKMMLYFPDSDELLSCDRAIEKRLIDQTLHQSLLQKHQGFTQPIKTSGLSVLLYPFTSLVSLEDCLSMKLLSYEMYLEILEQVRENPAVYQKCLVLPEDSRTFRGPVTIDEALERGIISSDVYKRVASSHPEALSLAAELEMYILCIESGKVARIFEAGPELGMSTRLVDQIKKQCRFEPHKLRKLMIYSEKQKQVYNPMEASRLGLIDASVYEELISSQKNALEFVFPTGMSVLYKIDTERLQSLEKCVQTNLLPISIFDHIAQLLEKDSANVTKVMFLKQESPTLISLKEALTEELISKEKFDKYVTSHRGLESIRKTTARIISLNDQKFEAFTPELAFNSGRINEDCFNEILKTENEKAHITARLFIVTKENRLINASDIETLEQKLDHVTISQLHNKFPKEFEPMDKAELKIYDWQSGGIVGLPEAVKNDVIPSAMCDNLISKMQSEPSQLTRVVLPVKQLMTSFTPSRALNENLISEAELHKLCENVNNPTWRLALPNLEVFDVGTKQIHSLISMIQKDLISSEFAQESLRPIMEPDFDNLNKMLIWIPQEKLLIDLQEACDREFINEQTIDSICRKHVRLIESYSLIRNIAVVNKNATKLVPIESLYHQNILNRHQYRNLSVKLAKHESMLGQIVLLEEATRSFTNLDRYFEGLDSSKNVLGGLVSLSSGAKLSSPSGLCVFDQFAKAIEPLERAFESKKIDESQFTETLASFQNEPEKTPGLLICAENDLNWPAEALVKQKIEPSEIRGLQQLHPKAFTPQPMSRVLVIQSESGRVLPLEAALNSGSITVEEFLDVLNRSKNEENFATGVALFNYDTLEPEKIPVAVICSAMDEVDYQKALKKSGKDDIAKKENRKDEVKIEEKREKQNRKLQKLPSPIVEIEPKPSLASKVEKTKMRGFMQPTKSSGQKKVDKTIKDEKKSTAEKIANPIPKTVKKKPTIRRLNDELEDREIRQEGSYYHHSSF